MIAAIPHASKGGTINYPDNEGPMSEDFRFEVLEVFKGNPGHEITVSGGNSEFSEGKEYLVFASLNLATQTPGTSVCSGNRLVENVDQNPDVAWLRAYPTAPPLTTIFGKVSWEYSAIAMGYGVADLPSITINLAGEKSLTASTTAGQIHVFKDLPPGSRTADQIYAFKDLPPGTYTLSAVVPDGYSTMTPRNTATVTVAAKGCAEIDWEIAHDTHIQGAVTDAAGRPASGHMIGLLRPPKSGAGFDRVAFQATDVNGHYDFSKIPPGDYWVALHFLGPNNLEPYAPVYYPSGEQSSSAKLIHVGPASNIENINLTLTPALHPVTLQVHVVNPDGTPVIEAHVIAEDPLTPGQAMAARANENGNGDITLYEGRAYSLIASTSGYREPACAGPVKFVAKEGLQLGTLTLDKSWDECRALQRAH